MFPATLHAVHSMGPHPSHPTGPHPSDPTGPCRALLSSDGRFYSLPLPFSPSLPLSLSPSLPLPLSPSPSGRYAGEREELLQELSAAKALASQAMRESDEQRQRLDRQAAAIASEGEALRRSNALAREGERRAEREVSALRARLDKAASGGQLDVVSTRPPLD
jgi:hypothetical protein